jgi:UDP-2-acetamido-3-amino-2,3-dideoxy-glucuronate N-acetyltransferase
VPDSISLLASLSDVRTIPFRAMSAEDRVLVPFEAEREVPFPIRRVFTINASRAGLVGGQHAHRRCQQLLVCLHGVCEVACVADDPKQPSVIRLDRPDRGVLVPPTIWAEERYLSSDCVLMVFCDQLYDPADYIRDWADFARLRGIPA